MKTIITAIALLTAMPVVPAKAGNVTPEYYGIAASLRIVQWFTGGRDWVVTGENSARSGDNSVHVIRNPETPCVIRATKANQIYEVKLDQIYDRWTVATYPYSPVNSQIRLYAGPHDTFCQWTIGAKKKECRNPLLVGNSDGQGERAISYLASHGCPLLETPPTPPF